MSECRSIRGVIFDMDGVLTDSEPLINAAAVAMFSEKGLVVQPEDFLPFVGMGENRYIGGVAEKYGFPLNLAEAKRRTYEIYLELVPTRLTALPGAVALVQACRQAGWLVAVASSADRIRIEANLRQIRLPQETWNAVVAAEDVDARKPAPDIFLIVASKLGLNPRECVVVEDAVNGVQAAKAAGMRCVAVAQTFPAEHLQDAELVRPTIAELSLADLAGATPPVMAGLPGPAETPGASTPPGPWGLWPTLGLGAAICACWLMVQVLVVIIWAVVKKFSVAPSEIGSNGLLLSLASCASAPVAFGLTCLFASLRRGPSVADYLGFRPAPIKALAGWTLALLLFIALSDVLTLGLGRPIVPEFMQQVYQSAGFMPLLWLTLLVAAPLMEEPFFRGFLFEGFLRSKLGAPGAVGLTALLWSFIHIQYDAYGITLVFVTGLLLGFVRLKTRSLYATMFLHALMNLVATLETVWVLR